MQVNASQVKTVNELLSNQEEADTKVILRSPHAINTTESSIISRFPSGDTDVMIIGISLTDTSKRVLVDYGNGKKVYGLTQSTWMTT